MMRFNDQYQLYNQKEKVLSIFLGEKKEKTIYPFSDIWL